MFEVKMDLRELVGGLEQQAQVELARTILRNIHIEKSIDGIELIVKDAIEDEGSFEDDDLQRLTDKLAICMETLKVRVQDRKDRAAKK